MCCMSYVNNLFVGYHDCRWVVLGVWHSTQTKQLQERWKIAAGSTQNAVEDSPTHSATASQESASYKEIQLLRKQLRNSQQETAKLQQQLIVKEDTVQELTRQNNQLEETLREKEEIIRQSATD